MWAALAEQVQAGLDLVPDDHPQAVAGAEARAPSPNSNVLVADRASVMGGFLSAMTGAMMARTKMHRCA